MSALLYRPDWAEARERMTRWWQGEDIGRAAMQITAPRAQHWEEVEVLPEPEGWNTNYSTLDLEYHVNVRLRAPAKADYFAEAVPAVNSGDLAPNCLALYLGCQGQERPGTVWCEPFLNDPEQACFQYDPDNFYWRFSQEAIQRTLELAGGKLLIQFPDLIEGLDTLAAMRGTEVLLVDLIERPEWVHSCVRQITDRYFHYYDILYDMIRAEVGGSVFWAWAPGRMAKFQCDISAMLSPAMFNEFMLPVLTEMTERVAHCMYHWDGPGAVCHLDALLSIPKLDMIQWTPGAGQPGTWDECWWPMYHEIIDAGKKLLVGAKTKEHLLDYRREFGEQSKQMLIGMGVESAQEAEECLRIMEC